MNVKTLLTAFSLSLIAGLASASGYHVTGYVNASSTSLYGSMNNRYNTSASTTTTYIGAYGSAGSTVTFFGRDGDGDTFSCYVTTSSTLYDAAIDIKNNLTNGGYLSVSKTATSTACTSVYLLNASYFLD
ncbi:hypothetical protein [Gynuella sunshinyii]|uniref:Uncharacterized protein n=1 Tax=Gynuella sunshinyii YC6258 TaxID=1445510 RepID=A0A0C5VRX3_9GAMM|nr:hypothetical protein [Gynuella sunshinyii]AJQ96981.1 hypothetical Protein YC6258_04949 [Gynuella sunshinyii YC6258]